MSFNLESFVAEPQLDKFNGLKKADLILLGQHHKLSINLSMGKGDIKKLILNYLVEEFFQTMTWNVPLRRENRVYSSKLEYQERDKALQLKSKELDVREKELALEDKAKELELHNARCHTVEALEHLVILVNTFILFRRFKSLRWTSTYFMHFEKIATSVKLPEEVWTVLFQSVLIGKA